jgi:hypothetical protein
MKLVTQIVYILGWLEPLLERLVEKADTVVCPQLQTISGSSFKVKSF